MALDEIDRVLDAARPAMPEDLHALPPDELDRRLAQEPRNDIGNADRFRARHGRDFVYVKNVGWHGWDGRRWNYEEGETRLRIAARRTVEAMVGEAKAANALADAEFERLRAEGLPAKELEAERERLDRQVAAAWKWALGSGNASRLKAMTDVAQPHRTCLPEDMDRDGFSFAVANGVLHLEIPDETGDGVRFARGHDRKLLGTRLSPVAYDPAATARPAFDAFLHRVQPDPEMRAFLQVWSGYCLTGSTAEQCLALLYGAGRNGKSTFIDLLAFILGDYAMSLPAESLMDAGNRSGAAASPDLARLPGARFVRAAEPKASAPLNEGLVKQLTGGEPIAARHNFEGFFEFVPQFKITLSFNERPTIKGADDGIWRRIRLVPWTVQIPEGEVDRGLQDKLRAEGPAVLNWMLDGYRIWRERGLPVPRAVSEATEEYRLDSDPIRSFLTDVTEPAEPDAWLGGKALFDAYEEWRRVNMARELTATAFGRALARVPGLHKVRVGTIRYLGLRWRAGWPPRPPDEPPY